MPSCQIRELGAGTYGERELLKMLRKALMIASSAALTLRADATTPTLYVFGGTRAWGAAAAVATATQRHDGDLFAVVLAPAPVAEMF